MKIKKIIAVITATAAIGSLLAGCKKDETVVVDVGLGITAVVSTDKEGNVHFEVNSPAGEALASELAELFPEDTEFEEGEPTFFREMTAANATLGNVPRTVGIDGNIAFWQFEPHRTLPINTKFAVHDFSSGNTTVINVISGIYYNGYVYGKNTGLNNQNDTIRCYDLQGNLVKETEKMLTNTFHVMENGGLLIVFVRNHTVGGAVQLVSPDFSTVTPLTITKDIGHGRTEESTDYTYVGVYNNKVYVVLGQIRSAEKILYTIDLSTFEVENTGVELNVKYPYLPSDFAIKQYFVFYNDQRHIVDIETGDNVSMLLNDVQFFGNNAYRITKERIYKLNSQWENDEVIFEFSIPVRWAYMLDEERAVSLDNVGMFIYNIKTGNMIAEIAI